MRNNDRAAMKNHAFLLFCLLALVAFTAGSPVHAASLGTWPRINVGQPAKLFLSGVAYGSGQWVAVGQGGYIAVSSDGVKWARKSAGHKRDFNDVCFSSGRFIAVCKAPDSGAGAKIWVSDDLGNSWKPRDTDAGGDTIGVGLHAVAGNGSGTLIAVGGSLGGQMTRSWDNGQTWHRVSSFSSPALYAVGYGKGVWIAGGNNRLMRSTDAGATWTDLSTSKGARDICYGNNRWMVADMWNNKLYWASSGNLNTWTEVTKAAGSGSGTSYSWVHGCTFADGLFVAVTEYGDIWTSETGREVKLWRATGGDPDIWAVGAGDRGFIAVGGDFDLDYGVAWASPPWLRARLGSSWDYPYTFFDAEEGLPQRIGLPQYRVNTASLNLTLEATLFYMRTLGAPVNLRLVYNSAPVADDSDAIGLFGKNWHLRYESKIGQFGKEALVVTGGGRPLLFTTPHGEDLSTATLGSPLTLLPPEGVFDELKFYGNDNHFEYREKASKRVYRYAVSGGAGNALWRLTRITDTSGNQVNLSVDGATGRIASITDPSGRQVTFTYNDDNRCTEITVPDGRTVLFEYDEAQNLTGITDMAGHAGVYAYEDLGFLKRMDTAGRVSRFAWKPRPGSEPDAANLQADGDRILSSVTNAAGGVVKYELLDKGGGVKRTDTRGETMVFKSREGQSQSITDPLGAVRSIEYTEAKLPASFTDDLGKVVTFEHDARGNLTSFTDALGHETELEYDASDNLVERTNVLGKVWTYGYDANHRLTSVTTPMLHRTEMTYYANGRLQTHEDARSHVTSYEYDAYGNLTRVTDPLSKQVRRGYDPHGLRCILLTDQRGKTKELAYDANDRLLTVDYTSAPGTPRRRADYDAFGQIRFTDELGQETEIERDEFGYPTSVTDPLGHVATTEYDPNHNPVRRVDALGRVASTTYDDLNRPLVFTDARGKVSSRSYDDAGNLTSFTDERKGRTQFAYDGNQRLTATTDALGKSVSLVRDAMGRVGTRTNARGQVVRYTYDDDNRLTQKEVAATAGGPFSQVATYGYDENGNLVEREDAWGAMTWVYNANNRTTSVSYPTGKSVAFTYDDAGLIETLTYPNGLVVTYSYDDFNRQSLPRTFRSSPEAELVGMAEKPNQVSALRLSKGGPDVNLAYVHDAAGRVTTLTRPAALVTRFTYDAAGRGESLSHELLGAALLQYGFTYDAVGNLIQEAVSGPHHLPPPLPELGVRKFDAANGLTAQGARGAVNDADGNLVSLAGGVFNAQWDAENRLTEFSRLTDAGTETVRYTYDAAGLRVKREVVGGATSHYHYGPGGQLLFVTDGSGTVTASFVWSGRALVAMLLGDSLTADLRYPLLNRLGSVVALADAAGAVVAKYGYDSYGSTLRETVPPGGSDANPFTFAGGYGVMDEGGGLFYMKERFYSAASGRFLQRDPLGLAGGTNLYAYAAGNPVTTVDAQGKAFWLVAVPVAIAAWSWYSAADNAAQAGQEAGRAVEAMDETRRAADRTVASHQRFREREAFAANPANDADARINAMYESRDAFNQMWNHDAPATADAAQDAAYHSARAVYRGGKAVTDAFGGVAVSTPVSAAKALEQAGEKVYEEGRDYLMEEATGLGEDEE